MIRGGWSHPTLLALVFAPAAFSQGLADIDSRSKEVVSLQSLACPGPGEATTPRQSVYRDSLLAAAKELRVQLGAFKGAVSHSSLLGDSKGDLLKVISPRLDALGDSDKDPCAAAADFAKASTAGSAHPVVLNPDIAISPSALSFAKKEVGDSDEASFTITNKGNEKLAIEGIEVHDCDHAAKNCDAQASQEFKLKQSAGACPTLLDKSDHCDVAVLFEPKTAGQFHGEVSVQLPGGSNTKSQLQPVKLEGNGYVANIVTVDSDGSTSHPSFRAVAGFDISGTTNADTEQKAFLEFDLNGPIGWSKYGSDGQTRTDPLNRRWWWFFNPRITSLPQEHSALSNLNVQGFTDFFTSKKTDLVQGVDLNGGIEYLFVKPRQGLPFFSSYKNTRARIGMALVAGAGFTTPFSTPQSNPTVFALADGSSLRKQFNVPDTYKNIAFVNLERSRFFRKYYGGIRFKTYHFSAKVKGVCDPDTDPCEGVYNQFPGIIDLTVGQDDQVTAGRLSRWMFRLDGVYPLPFGAGFHLFGSLYSVFQKNALSNPLILPATSTTALSDPSVFIVHVPPRSRDLYRIGLGVDLMQIIKKASSNPNQAQEAPATQPKQTQNQNPAPAKSPSGTTDKKGPTGGSAPPTNPKPGTGS